MSSLKHKKREKDYFNFSIRVIFSSIREMSLRTKMLIFAVAIGMLPTLVLGVLAYTLVSQATTKEITNTKQDTAKLLADNINSFLYINYGDIQRFFQQSFLENPQIQQAPNRQVIEEKLKKYISNAGSNFENITILDVNGNLIADSKGQEISNQKNQEYFQAILKTNKPYLSQNIIKNSSSTKPESSSIYLAAPIKDSTSKTVYVVLAVMPIQALEKTLAIFQINEDEYTIVDSSGKIIFSQKRYLWGKNFAEVFPEWEQLQAKNQVTSQILFEKNNNNQKLVTYVPLSQIEGLPDTQWRLILSTNIDIAFATQRQLFLAFQIGTIATALLVGGIAAILANRLVRPILATTTAVKKLGTGSLDTRIAIAGSDEFAVLGSNINQMANQLQNLLRQQTAEAEQLKLLTNILHSLRQSNNSEELFNITVQQARSALTADRVVIYQFNTCTGGKVIAESVETRFPATLENLINDACIPSNLIEAYTKGRVLVINNVLEANFSTEHLKLMERLQVKANLVVPIIKNDQLFGFLIAHHCRNPHNWQPYEVSFLRQLAIQVGLTLERVSLLEVTQILKDTAISLSKANSSGEIYNLAVQNIRQALKVDRAIFYIIDEDFSGSIIAESVVAGWPCCLGTQVDDPCLVDYVEKHWQAGVIAINDIYQANLSDCYIQQLERFAVKANLVAPILLGDKLLGLLIAHQCSQPRFWQQSEISLFEQFVRIVSLSLERANLLEQAQKGRTIAETVSQQQRLQKEQLELQLLQLIDQVREASQGNLTVRAEVSSGEIGTIAEFLNYILENLQEIIIQVKQAASQVDVAIASNFEAMDQLAVASLKQTKEINRTLEAVDQMQHSIIDVARTAEQAAEVARNAYQVAETGGSAMDLTVENIIVLRETIDETGKQVKRLGESSQKISRVVALINEIAMKINLLAINTKIEAAHAGEEVQGFVAIAQEVGMLAAHSSAATAEIEEIVANIQLETSQVVKAMELGTTQVMEGTRLVQNTKQNLNHILDVCRQIDQLVNAISAATISQVQTSTEVSALMEEIAKISQITSNSSRQASTLLQQTMEISQQLQARVRTFKVS
ncbi:chemotaxis protein [Fischerella thermalis CCMEE 5318]|uniref:Chemotaxis protein n=2 Tax=Fischerella TaxID=1190 RepID=A0A2N6LFN3_9CYAN|nr:chemotaxis protein [Fischerella thermalis CCMEE 5318]